MYTVVLGIICQWTNYYDCCVHQVMQPFKLVASEFGAASKNT